MSKFDTHVAIYGDNKDLMEDLSRRGYASKRVSGASTTRFPKTLFTLGAETKEHMSRSYFEILDVIRRYKADALVESEVTVFDRPVYRFERDDVGIVCVVRALRNASRPPNRLHFGDLHLDIPFTDSTEELRQVFAQAGYNFLRVEKVDGPHDQVTVQFESPQLAQSLRAEMENMFRSVESGLQKAALKFERLIHYDCVGSAIPLPITTGFR